MFLDESAFDLEDNDKGYNRRTITTENRYSKNPGKKFGCLLDKMKLFGDELKNHLDCLTSHALPKRLQCEKKRSGVLIFFR